MRLYKGKRIDNGEWKKGWYVYSRLHDKHFIFADTVENDEHDWRHEVHPDSVGQSIGRKDKNDVEIYKGDDIDVSMSFEGGTLPHRGVIVYDATFGAFGTKNEAGITLLHNHCLHTAEVIGNVHDNPELGE